MDHVKQQVEQIIDEGEGPRRRVIVQMQANEQTNQRLLSIAAEVHQRRNLSVSARQLLPATQPEMEIVNRTAEAAASKRLPAQAKRVLESSDASLATQIGVALRPIAQEQMRSAALEYLAPLLRNELVKKSMNQTVTEKEKVAAPVSASVTSNDMPAFWSSRSVALDIAKDDLAKLASEVPEIQDVYPNRTIRLPRVVEVKDLPAPVADHKASAWGISKIGALAVWGAYGACGKGTKIAVLDTGIDAEHPDLKGKVTSWAEFDEDGFPVRGSKPHDSDQHGTHCAGTIAGGNASGSWIGVAPEAEIAAALVLKGGVGTDAQILAGIEWAIEQGVDAISMSLGGLTLDPEPPDPYTQALLSALAAGIPVVTAIGNEGSQTTGAPGNDWFAFSIGATDYLDRPAGFSGGRTHVLYKSRYLRRDVLPLIYSKPELSAPGVAVMSSIPGGKWAAFNGTSMATPHVAGAIALLLSATDIRDKVTDAQRAFLIQDLLTGSVEELGEAGQDHRYGFGRIEVLRAIGFAKEGGY